MLQHPFVVVDRVDIVFSEVRRDSHRGETIRFVLLQPVDGGENHRARGASKQESMFGQTTAGTDGVSLLDKHHLIDEGLIQLRRTDGRAQTGYHAAARCTAEGYRTDAVNSDDTHRSGPLPQI